MDFVLQFHIQEMRKIRKLSIRELADISGVSKSEISGIERGVKNPTVYVICLLAIALEVSPYKLFTMKIKRPS